MKTNLLLKNAYDFILIIRQVSGFAPLDFVFKFLEFAMKLFVITFFFCHFNGFSAQYLEANSTTKPELMRAEVIAPTYSSSTLMSGSNPPPSNTFLPTLVLNSVFKE